MLVAGIDGGQSASRAALADENGTILTRIDGPPLFSSESDDDAGVVAGIIELLRRVRSAASLSEDAVVSALVAGVSGQDVETRVSPHKMGANSTRLVHDAEIAHTGALAGAHGILVIAGSGSVALGTDATGRRVRRGGWGRTFGDEGGGFWIARRALARATHAFDDGTTTALPQAACRHFGVGSLRALQKAALRGVISEEDVARFAPIVLALAAEGDPVATRVRAEAAAELAALVSAVDRALAPHAERAVSYAGRIFDDAGLRDLWQRHVTAALPGARVVSPQAEPVIGALFMAYRDAGVDVPWALQHAAAR